MLPISMAGSMRRVPPQRGHSSPASTSWMSATSRLEVPAQDDVAQVVAGAVGARHVGALAQRLVDDDAPDAAVGEADRAQGAGLGAEGLLDLVAMGRPEALAERLAAA